MNPRGILVFADFPRGCESRTGSAQRILAIDRLIQHEPRVYVRLSIFRYWIPVVEHEGSRMSLHAHLLPGIPMVLHQLVRARIVYVHSVYHALYAFFLLPWFPFIFDAHGVVPEEEALAGHAFRSRLFSFIERVCIRYAKACVCVTRRMADHFRDKYPAHGIRILLLPILDPARETPMEGPELPENAGPAVVIYSGKVQPWQNVDLMIQTMERLNGKYVFKVYSPDTETFQQRMAGRTIHCSVESLDSQRLHQEYAKAQFGFLLRSPDLVNRVACPTKLAEYLEHGIIPILLQPEIGDLLHLGIRHVLLEDFLADRVPGDREIRLMRQENRKILEQWRMSFSQGVKELRALMGVEAAPPAPETR